jgi:hypothetical protein
MVKKSTKKEEKVEEVVKAPKETLEVISGLPKGKEQIVSPGGHLGYMDDEGKFVPL